MPKIIRVLPVVAAVMAGSGLPACAQANPGDAAPSAAKLERLSRILRERSDDRKAPRRGRADPAARLAGLSQKLRRSGCRHQGCR